MVVMPEYLTTSPKGTTTSKPRIISEVKKNCLSKLKLGFTTSFQDFGKSKYSGQLLWKTGNSEWVLRTGDVRQGSLILINEETSGVELKQPLRELNLRPCAVPRTFCLAEATGVPLLVFQALTEEEYEKWVRILAVELLRQTPLQTVRFLDILSILRSKDPDKAKGGSEERVPAQENQPKEVQKKKMRVAYQRSLPVVPEAEKPGRLSWKAQSMTNLSEADRKPESEEEGHEEGIFFMSVRERKNFFESLTSDKDPSPLVRSNSIGNFEQTNVLPERSRFQRRKRTKSLHDLHKTPVREMCQLFESQEKEPEPVERNSVAVIAQRRLQRGERKLEKLKNQIADVEEAIRIVAEDIRSLGENTLRRKEGLEVFAGLQKRLDEENCRLERLKEEMGRVLKGNQRTMLKLGRTSEKCL